MTMLVKDSLQDSLLQVTVIDGQLVIRKRKAPLRAQLLILTALFTGLSLLLASYIAGMRTRPGLLLYVVVLAVLTLVVAERAWHLRSVSQKDDVFRFDKDGNTVERNGETIAGVKDVDHVLLRRIRPDTEQEKADTTALVVALKNSRRFTIAESTGLPHGQDQIEEAARRLAAYLEVKVQQGERFVTEYWMDQ